MENLSTNEPYVFLGQGPGVRGHKPREREHVQPPPPAAWGQVTAWLLSHCVGHTLTSLLSIQIKSAPHPEAQAVNAPPSPASVTH